MYRLFLPLPLTLPYLLPFTFYLLPFVYQTARTQLGEQLHRILTADNCNPLEVLAYMDLSSEHAALEAANKLESSMWVWQRRVARYGKQWNSDGDDGMGCWDVDVGMGCSCWDGMLGC